MRESVYNQTCGCCAYSGAYSSFYQVCPDTSAQDFGIDWFFKYESNFFDSSECDGFSDANGSCVADHGFHALPDNSTTYSAYSVLGSASVKATSTLSDIQGQVTSPASGYTLTWTANDTPHTITATSTTVKPENSGSIATATTRTAASTASGSATASKSGSAATVTIDVEAGAIAVGLIAVVIML